MDNAKFKLPQIAVPNAKFSAFPFGIMASAEIINAKIKNDSDVKVEKRVVMFRISSSNSISFWLAFVNKALRRSSI